MIYWVSVAGTDMDGQSWETAPLPVDMDVQVVIKGDRVLDIALVYHKHWQSEPAPRSGVPREILLRLAKDDEPFERIPLSRT